MSKQKLIKEWCEALESGKYIQGYTRLKQIETNSTISHCCLGVLCDLVAPDQWVKDPDYIWFDHYWARGIPAQEVTDKAGLTVDDITNLYEMNDSGDYTFKDISNYIKDNFLNDSTESD